jgi:hypothetical protein
MPKIRASLLHPNPRQSTRSSSRAGRVRIVLIVVVLAAFGRSGANCATCPDFAAAVNYGAGSGPEAMALGDVNGDGKPDLAVADNGSNMVSILLGNGDGTFGAAVPYGVGTQPVSVALGNPGSAGNVVRGLESYTGFTPAQLRAVYRDNAVALFPRLRQA